MASYQLKDVGIAWYEIWMDSKGPNTSQVVWNEFSNAFVEHFFSQEIREERVRNFYTFDRESIESDSIACSLLNWLDMRLRWLVPRM